MPPKDELYQEVYNEVLADLLKTHVPMDEVAESINKLLDKINIQKKIIKAIYKHYKKDLDNMNVPFRDKVHKKTNLEQILKEIELELVKETEDTI